MDEKGFKLQFHTSDQNQFLQVELWGTWAAWIMDGELLALR